MTKKRMTDLDIKMIVEEIEAWGKLERSPKLTWKILENIFPFTRQTMYSKKAIQMAYNEAQIALKTGKRMTPKPILEDGLRVQKLKNRIRELEKQIEGYQELWIRYEFNTLRHGIDPDILREGLPEKPRPS